MTNYRQLAKDKPCMIRLEGCDGKANLMAVYLMSDVPVEKSPRVSACRNCLDIVGGGKKTNHDRTSIRLKHAEAVIREQVNSKR